MQIQILAVFCKSHSRRVCQKYRGVVTSPADIVDHHIVENPGLLILALHIEVITGNLVVKNTFRNLHLRTLLFH